MPPTKPFNIKVQAIGKIGNQVLATDEAKLDNTAEALVLTAEPASRCHASSPFSGMPRVKYIQKNLKVVELPQNRPINV